MSHVSEDERIAQRIVELEMQEREAVARRDAATQDIIRARTLLISWRAVADKRRFVRAARQVLDRETYLRIWEIANGEKGDTASHA